MARQNIGTLGPAESASVTVRWYPFFSYPALSLWVFFVAVLTLGFGRRHGAAWLILIPAGLIHLIWLLVKATCGFSASEGELTAQIFVPLYITIALLFALTHPISRRNRFVSFFLALLVVAVGGLASFFAYNYNGTGIAQWNRLALAFSVIMGAAFLMGLTLAVLLSRKRYGWLKFTASLLVFAFIFAVTFVFLYGLYDFGLSNLDDFMEVLVVSLMLGLCLCGVVLPFLILAFTSSYYRRALESLVSLSPTQKESTASESEPAT